ncbi:MAG: putative DNA-binding transcriptional regulator [Patescibacteria group bacterium]|jgi:predicted DNA-binding transcriptional regulator
MALEELLLCNVEAANKESLAQEEDSSWVAGIFHNLEGKYDPLFNSNIGDVTSQQAEENLKHYVNLHMPTLREVSGGFKKGIMAFMQVEKGLGVLAKKLVERGWVSPEVPLNYKVRSQGNWYFDREVVGQEQAEENKRRYVTHRVPSLGAFPEKNNLVGLSGILGLDKGSKVLAMELVKRGWVSPEVPLNYKVNGRFDWYLDSDVVGRKQAEKNKKRHIRNLVPSLEDVPKLNKLTSMATMLEVPLNTKSILTELVRKDWVSPLIPQTYEMGLQGNWYFNEEVVGVKQSEENKKVYLTNRFPRLIDISAKSISSTIAGLLGQKRGAKYVARELVTRGWVSSDIPLDYELKPSGNWYFQEGIVGEEQAIKNRKIYLQQRFTSVEDIDTRPRRSIANSLELNKNIKLQDLREHIVSLGILPAESPRETYAQTTLPDSFTQAKRKAPNPNPKKQKSLEEISDSLEETSAEPIHFLKGEAFEQVVGTTLAYNNPDELVIPQYCIDVTDTRFKTRADFKVANTIYEVKWGNHKENIESTYQKHMDILEGSDLDYQVIRLEDHVNVDIPTTNFTQYTENTNEARESIERVTSYLQELSQDSTQDSTQTMKEIRDYFYSTNMQANNLSGEERKSYLQNNLQQAADRIGTDDLSSYLRDNTQSVFRPLEAFFEHEGQLYQSMISVPQLQKEQEDRYQMVYGFGDLRFESKEDRDLGVLLELSPQGGRVENLIQSDARRIKPGVAYELKDGQKYSSQQNNGYQHIPELSALRGNMVSEEDFDFAMTYIDGNGAYC